MNIEIPDDAIRKAITDAILTGNYGRDPVLQTMARSVIASRAKDLERLLAEAFSALLSSDALRIAVAGALTEAIAAAAKEAAEKAVRARVRKAADAAEMFAGGKP